MKSHKGFIPEKVREHAIVITLMGQPNVGKSTIYNSIVGATQHIGNWPGKTVEIAWSEKTFDGQKLVIVDLPGTYTLTGLTEEEEVAINFLLQERPDVVIVITDVSALPRNLYLLLQVLEVTDRVVLVVNMMDEAKRWGIKVDLEKLSKAFGVPVVGTIAIRGEGLEEMLRKAIEVAKSPRKRKARLRYGPLEPYIEKLENILSEVYKDTARLMAIRILEGDMSILNKLSGEKREEVINTLDAIKKEFKKDPKLLISSVRYEYIDKILLEAFQKGRFVDSLTDVMDRIFFRRGIDIILSFLILFGSFFVAFEVGSFLTDLLDKFLSYLIDSASPIIESYVANQVLSRFIIDGILGGIASALIFFPLIFVFSFTLAFIENLGVFARISLAIDKFFAKFDASGRAFFSLMTGLACNVISVASTRILPSHKERIRIMIVSQFIQCPPRQVVMALILGMIFSPLVASVLFGTYIILGFLLALIVSRVMKSFEGPARREMPIELPPYRLPSLRVLGKISWNRSIVFIKRAGVLIILANMVFWVLMSIPPGAPPEGTILGIIGGALSYIFQPLGLGWKETLALLAGLVAKEITLGVLDFLYGGIDVLVNAVSIASILAFITIYAYYMPCIATIMTIKGESGSWLVALKAILISFFIALALGYLTYLIALAVL